MNGLNTNNPHPLVAARPDGRRTVVRVGNVNIGAGNFVMMAGPCSVESETQVMACARVASQNGAKILRGGAYKPRTSPYDFQGLHEEGLKFLSTAARRYGLKVVTEVLDIRHIEQVALYADILQIGARNMQHAPLLVEAGQTNMPILLKRGPSATIKELLCAAEYIAATSNTQIMLCERGIRTFEPSTRNTLDLSAVTVMAELTHLPIIVDPSHGVGRRNSVPALTRAAVAVGADGAIVEIHPNPPEAWSDGPQSLTFPMFEKMMHEVRAIDATMQSLVEQPVQKDLSNG